MTEHCANPKCPRRDSRADYLGPANSIMLDAPDRPSFGVCSWACLAVVAQMLSARSVIGDSIDSSVINEQHLKNKQDT